MTVQVVNFPTLPDLGGTPEQVAKVANNAMRGKTNNVTEVTLAANAATTTFSHPLIGAFSGLFFTPLTANAQAIATPRPSSQGDGSCTLNHANDANADKTFKVAIIG